MKRLVLMILVLDMFLSAQAAQAGWAPARRLTWTAGDSACPAIAAGSSGHLHLVWQDRTPGNDEIYYRKSTDAGATWPLNRRLTWNAGSSVAPDIAVDPSGNPHVVWHDNTPGNLEIFYRKSTDAGATWVPKTVLTSTSGDSIYPDLAVDSSGNPHVVWQEYVEGNYEIYYRKSTDGGTTWTPAQRLSWTATDSGRPAIAFDSSGILAVLWHDYEDGDPYEQREIYLRRSTNGGSSWALADRLSWTSGDSEYPDIAPDSLGNLHVAYMDKTPGNVEIYYFRMLDGATARTATRRLTQTSGESSFPAIAVDSSGNPHVVWYDNSPGNLEIYYKKSEDGGATWMPIQRLTWDSAASLFPDIAVDSSDHLHLVWHDNRAVNPIWNLEIFYRSYQ